MNLRQNYSPNRILPLRALPSTRNVQPPPPPLPRQQVEGQSYQVEATSGMLFSFGKAEKVPSQPPLLASFNKNASVPVLPAYQPSAPPLPPQQVPSRMSPLPSSGAGRASREGRSK